MHIWKTFKVSYVYPGIAKVSYYTFKVWRLSKSPKRLWKSRLLQASLAAAEKSPSKSLCKCLLYFDTIPSWYRQNEIKPIVINKVNIIYLLRVFRVYGLFSKTTNSLALYRCKEIPIIIHKTICNYLDTIVLLRV